MELVQKVWPKSNKHDVGVGRDLQNCKLDATALEDWKEGYDDI